jgi:hypothetical protein
MGAAVGKAICSITLLPHPANSSEAVNVLRKARRESLPDFIARNYSIKRAIFTVLGV